MDILSIAVLVVGAMGLGLWWVVSRRAELRRLVKTGNLIDAQVVGSWPLPDGQFWEVTFQYSPSGGSTFLCNDHIRVAPLEQGPPVDSSVKVCYSVADPKVARMVQSAL